MRAYQIDPRPLLKSVKPIRNGAYLKFIRSQPCCVTGQNWGVEACHTGPHGLDQKATDLDAIPLIPELHRTGDYALDKLGREGFEQHWGVTIQHVINSLLIRADAAGIDLLPPAKKPMGKARRSMYRRRAA